MKIPCKNCLMVPICRNKTYNYLMDQCVTLKDTVYIDEIHSNHLVIDKNNHNFDVIFGFNIKYVFDMYRYNLLLYLIEDSEKNINKINNIILNAKKERKINNKNIFIESVLNNLEIESKYSENYSKSGNNLIKLIKKSGNVNNKTIINSNRIILKNKNYP